MQAVIRDVHVAGNDDAPVLGKGGQDGRRYRDVRWRSGNDPLDELIPACVIKNFRIRRVPGQTLRIRARHIRLRDNGVAAQIDDGGVPIAAVIEHEITIIGVEWSNCVVKMSCAEGCGGGVGDARNRAAEDWIRVALTFRRWSEGVV